MSLGKFAAQNALKDPKGGLTAAGRAHFKRTEGANLKPGVKGPADTPDKMRRKGSFLSRMFGPGAPGAMTKDNGEPSRRALSASAWGEPVPKNDSDRAALYAKGQRLLERYKNKKEGAEAPPWEQENPKKKSKELSDSQKAEAKRRARAAGRPYPNLVDNMAAAKRAALNTGAAVHAGEDLVNLARGARSPRALKALVEQFEQHKKDLEAVGHNADTFHKRVVIPKEALSEKQIGQLGFVPSRIAIPEGGQDRFTSFRHPDHNYHIHSHPGYWTMHLDDHPSSTMLAMKAKTVPGKVKAYLEGIPHVVTEGIPGLYAYARGYAGDPTHIALGSLPGAIAGGLHGVATSDDRSHPDVLRVLRDAGIGAAGGGLLGGVAGRHLLKSESKIPVVTGSSMVDRLLHEGAISHGPLNKAATWRTPVAGLSKVAEGFEAALRKYSGAISPQGRALVESFALSA